MDDVQARAKSIPISSLDVKREIRVPLAVTLADESCLLKFFSREKPKGSTRQLNFHLSRMSGTQKTTGPTRPISAVLIPSVERKREIMGLEESDLHLAIYDV